MAWLSVRFFVNSRRSGSWAAASAIPSAAMAQVTSSRITTSRPHFAPQTSHVVIPQTGARRLDQQPSEVAVTRVEAAVRVTDRTAETTMRVHLENRGSRIAEAVLLLPLADEAVVTGFTFVGTASEPTAALLPQGEARRLYDSIVRTLRDPALLEFVDHRFVRSSVFPVAPGGTQMVEVTFEHVLGGSGDRVDYVLPRSATLAASVPWNVTMTIDSGSRIGPVYSPSHDIETKFQGSMHADVRIASTATQTPGPFRVSWTVASSLLGGSLFAYPDSQSDGGWFLFMAGAPARDEESRAAVRREVVLVIDRSGSMAGEKMDQTRAAALQVIEGLGDDEYFNIFDYSTRLERFSAKSVPRTRENILAARAYLDAMRPGGGTNIHDALLAAVRQAPQSDDVLPVIFFLTDGVPTVGTTTESVIRDAASKANGTGWRIFSFGVGVDVNAPLLDRIAENGRGMSTYVHPGENIETRVADVFQRMEGPMLTGLALSAFDANGQLTTRLVQDVMPVTLPDVFEGDQLILLGRYAAPEHVTFQLEADYHGERTALRYAFDLSESDVNHSFVPRLWASRRIAELVDIIRQTNADAGGGLGMQPQTLLADEQQREIIEEIVRLSTRFGILTEYTSFLDQEGSRMESWGDMVVACGFALNERAIMTRAGQAAVSQAENIVQQKSQSVLNIDNRYRGADGGWVSGTSMQQLACGAMIRRGNGWVDSELITEQTPTTDLYLNFHLGERDPKATAMIDRTITFGSDEHLTLARELARTNRQGTLAVDGDIVLRHDGDLILVRAAK